MKALTILPVCAAGIGVSAQSGRTAKVANGTVQGSHCASTPVDAFLSIPYAKPPLGDLRFAPPEPYGSLNGTLDATQPSTSCPQFNSAFAVLGPQSEDCLYLDVWVPSTATADSKLPVKVWLYGGGNAAGGIAEPLYDGCFAATDTIQVSVNYRVGPLGFLALQSAGLDGNYGIQDQLLGLSWVRENIAAFGGDPSKVLLFGQSAGATDTFIISSLPQAPELMSAAVMQSGAGSMIPTIDAAKAANEDFVKGLNCSTTDLPCLRSAPVDQMNATYQKVGRMPGPVVDGRVIPSQPLDVGPRVASIIGSTTNEGSLFLLAQYRTIVLSLNESVYDGYLSATFGENASDVKSAYPLSDFAASQAPVFAAMSTVSTHVSFRCPARRALTRAAAGGIATYQYSFGHTPSCAWYAQIPNLPPVLSLLGATHTAEIPFVFAHVDALPAGAPGANCSLTAGEKDLSLFMKGAWDNMAASGSPGSGWPAFEVGSSTGVNVGEKAEFGTVDYSMCDFWDKIAGFAMNETGVGGGNGTVGGGGSGTSGVTGTTEVMSVGWVSALLGSLAGLLALLL